MNLMNSLDIYRNEIDELTDKYLELSMKGGTIFGIVDENVLKAVASVRCYRGHWLMRGCIVKPEYRGNGFQRELIKERLEFVQNRMNHVEKVRVKIFPDKIHSIRNYIASGFFHEKDEIFNNGKLAHVFRYNF